MLLFKIAYCMHGDYLINLLDYYGLIIMGYLGILRVISLCAFPLDIEGSFATAYHIPW